MTYLVSILKNRDITLPTKVHLVKAMIFLVVIYGAWKGEPAGFSQVAAGALDLGRGTQGPALVASGKDIPQASCSGASRDSSPIDAGA